MNKLSKILEFIGNTIGANPNTLTTTSKTLVGAINEINHNIDFYYPVGSYYETSNASFDPNVTWGGTWVLDSAGRVTVARNASDTSFDTLGETGGSKNAVIPYHNHGTSVSQPAFNTPNHTHHVGSGRSFVTHSSADSASIGETSCSLPGSGYYVPTIKSGDNWYGSVTTASSGGGVACSRTANVGVTVNYAGSSGNATNANLQPYIVVNRWHRTA